MAFTWQIPFDVMRAEYEYVHYVHSLGNQAWLAEPREKVLKSIMISHVYQRSSKEGEECWKQADQLRKQGNEALKKGHISLAGSVYLKGQQYAAKAYDNDDQTAILSCNNAYVQYLLGYYESASMEAAVCSKLKPDWFKGPYRRMQVLQAVGRTRDAIELGIIILNKYEMSNAEELNVLKEVIELITKTPDEVNLLTEVNKSEEQWTQLVRQMAENKNWHMIHWLSSQMGDDGPLIMSYKADGIRLSGLLETCSPKQWREWGENLAETLIEKGAPVESLDPLEKYPLHFVLNTGIKAGSYNLLEYLFKHLISAAERNTLDQKGNSLLHIACKGSYKSQQSVVRLLLENNVDPDIINKEGLYAVDLLPPDSSCVLLLQRTMEKEVDGLAKEKTFQHCMPALKLGSENTATYRMSYTRKLQAVKSWKATEVKKWLEETELDFMKSRMKDISGPEVVELRMMLDTAPGYFYKSFLENIGLSLGEKLKLGNKLRGLY